MHTKVFTHTEQAVKTLENKPLLISVSTSSIKKSIFKVPNTCLSITDLGKLLAFYFKQLASVSKMLTWLQSFGWYVFLDVLNVYNVT